MKRAPCAAGFPALIDGLLLRLSLVCRGPPTGEISIGGERSALFAERSLQDARFAALRTRRHSSFFRTGPDQPLPCDHPAPISLLLYAIAPQEMFFGSLGALGGPALGFTDEQMDASMSHFLPPSLVHSAMARCCALTFVPDVPQATISPSAATAPQMLLKLVSTTHWVPPDLLKYCSAILSSVALLSF